ncbi:cytochrome c-type biogenesis protein [Ferrimonas aestuarii]|uniref:Cytochrome c-type biogenesis protein n=1 Tax=Ferrimonas aestuarii TaxID=2569539 RepID=A0A4U1BGL9_9GAMM|nr:cytochrome c-type biogenesis protein [Ferrimonas aestuarii]TKB50147.1 cytochrome c-type biogenesis protein CcmH [Ferrimonas aestuarii]
MRSWLTIFCCLFVLVASAPAANAGTTLTVNQQMEQIAATLRCPSSTNQTLLESEAAIAFELKALIAQQLTEGKSHQQIEAYLVERYGEQIRYQPGLNAGTAILWLTPVVLIFLLFVGLWFNRRRSE